MGFMVSMRVADSAFRVSAQATGLGFRVLRLAGLGFRVEGLAVGGWFTVWCGAAGSGFGVLGLVAVGRFGVQGLASGGGSGFGVALRAVGTAFRAMLWLAAVFSRSHCRRHG